MLSCEKVKLVTYFFFPPGPTVNSLASEHYMPRHRPESAVAQTLVLNMVLPLPSGGLTTSRSLGFIHTLTSTWPHLNSDVGLEEGEC